jgi:crotonobetainyl-CoA:carnitine CoA-transferase CaiB-like acyl-CoA transferase
MSGPLSGVRVVDLTSVVFGPLATQILGDLGADIIKVESPEGDTTRFTGPARSKDMAALFMSLNRNKRSVVLDLKTPEGKDALWKLIETADVFIHSMRPEKMIALGFSYTEVLKKHPKIVYVGLHGYLSEGPYSGKPAYDDVIQGQCGAASLMTSISGEPRYVPLIIADKTCALAASNAVTSALFARERTGKGQFVEVPMFETMVFFVFVEHLYGRTFDEQGELGYSRLLAPWRRPYKTKDGYICMLAYTNPQWRKFWTEIGRAELINDPRFINLAARSQNISELYQLAGASLQGRSTEEWLQIFEKLDIPCGRISTLDDVFNDPHLKAVNLFEKSFHPTEGEFFMTNLPLRFSENQIDKPRMPPKFGEHGPEIFAEIGLSEDEIANLVAVSHSQYK